MIKKFTSIDEVNNKTSDDVFKPKIALIGVGGAGTNAVNNMISMGLNGVKFVVVNTDSKSLDSSSSPYKLQIGPKVTKGLGAGSKPEIGAQAAEESVEDVKEIIKDVNLLFITAGMGGGTGTGASQVIARLAKEMDILTISFVTKPFTFEGNQKMDIAEQGITELEKYSDALVVISNQNLFSVVDTKTSLSDAFRETDGVLYSGIKAITDLLVASGLVNLDFNDVKYVIEGKGRAMIGSAESSGEHRAETIAKQAVLNPLLEDVSILGAKSVLINITGSTDMTLYEVDKIISAIKQELDSGAFINFGAIHDDALVDTLRLSIVATSLQDKDKILTLKQNKQSEMLNKTLSYSNSVYQKAQKKVNSAYSIPENYSKEQNEIEPSNSVTEKKSNSEKHYKENNNNKLNHHNDEENSYSNHNNIQGKVLNNSNLQSNNDNNTEKYKNLDTQKYEKINSNISEVNLIDKSIMFTTINNVDKDDIEFEDFQQFEEQVVEVKEISEQHSDINNIKAEEFVQNKSYEEEYVTVKKNSNKSKNLSNSSSNNNHDNDDEVNNQEPKNHVNLFDLIMKKDKKKEESLRNKIQEGDIINIKNRNKISKETNMIEEKEDSFFDLPAFLRKGK